MPGIDASIPLSGIAPKLPSAGDMVSLQAMMQDMQRKKLKSDQETAQLASEKAVEGLAAGVSAYMGAPPGTPEEQRVSMMKQAQREYFETLGKKGQGRLYGWNDQKVNELATHDIPIDRALSLIDQVPQYKDMAKRGMDLRMGMQEGKGGVALQNIGEAQPQPKAYAQGSFTPGMSQEEIDKKYADMPDAPEIAISRDGDKIQAAATPVDIDAQETPVESVKDLYRRAKERESKAADLRKQGRYDLADKASADAKDLRSSAAALETRQQKDRSLDQADERIKNALEKAKATNIPLSKEAVDFAVSQYLNGNSQALVGYARNQLAQAQFRERIPTMAQEIGMGPKDANAAIANFRGILAEEQTLGHRTAQLAIPTNELEGFIPLAEESIGHVSRTSFRPINRLIEMGTGQWSPEQRDLVNKTQAVLNAYAQVASRGGISVHSQELAEKQLLTADSPEVYKTALRAIWAETQRAMKAPGAAREETRRELITGTPREEKPYPGAPASEPQKKKGQTYFKSDKAKPIEEDKIKDLLEKYK